MEPLGTKLRRHRRRLGYTLDELSGRTGISKPYLSLIETGRVPNPPSDEKLRRIYSETGGLSGKPLRDRSTEIIRHLYQQSRGRLPIIGVGGIFTAEDAWEKITAGASLVQIYTGLVFEGPGIAKCLVNGLRSRLAESGLSQLAEAVGIAAG